MKAHLVEDWDLRYGYTLCGRVIPIHAQPHRSAKKCKRCKRLLKKEWYCEG